MPLRDVAMSRIGYGYRRLHILIEREDTELGVTSFAAMTTAVEK
jgi:hypothetical protein